MPYDLQTIKAPRLTGNALAAAPTLLENALTRAAAIPQMIKQTGLEAYRARAFTDSPTVAPRLPRSTYPGATEGAPVDLAHFSGPQAAPAKGFAFASAADYVQAYKDGKTTSVALMDFEDDRSLRTNGKSDGAINMAGGPIVSDEITMTLTGALPLAFKPDAREAAVIGIGTNKKKRKRAAKLFLAIIDRLSDPLPDMPFGYHSRRWGSRGGAAPRPCPQNA